MRAVPEVREKRPVEVLAEVYRDLKQKQKERRGRLKAGMRSKGQEELAL
jgi:hypothetical protein